MKFLEHEIVDPPTHCPRQEKCAQIVQNTGLLVANLSALTQELMPNSLEERAEDNTSKNEATMAFANGIINALPTVVEMEKHMPAAQRCGGCVITCALSVIRDGGAV